MIHFAEHQTCHSDHLNTPRAVTNQAQQLVWRWENQEPFGNSPPEENLLGVGNFEFNLRFSGQYFDNETGLSYNYFRDYDSQTDRYVKSDPIGLAGGITRRQRLPVRQRSPHEPLAARE
jgi:RHS repeat-associated protein